MRRLAFAAEGFSAAIFMANYILPARLLPWLALLCAAAALGLGFMRRKWLRAFVITLAALAVGFVWFGGTYLAKALPAKALDGETAELEGVVLTYSAEYDVYCRYEMRLRLPDGGVTRAVVYDRSGAAIYAEPGWRICGTARITTTIIQTVFFLSRVSRRRRKSYPRSAPRG